MHLIFFDKKMTIFRAKNFFANLTNGEKNCLIGVSQATSTKSLEINLITHKIPNGARVESEYRMRNTELNIINSLSKLTPSQLTKVENLITGLLNTDTVVESKSTDTVESVVEPKPSVTVGTMTTPSGRVLDTVGSLVFDGQYVKFVDGKYVPRSVWYGVNNSIKELGGKYDRVNKIWAFSSIDKCNEFKAQQIKRLEK